MATKRRSRTSRGRRSSRSSHGNYPVAVVGAPAEAYCSICGPGHASKRGRCSRHGKKLLPNMADRVQAIRDAQSHARATHKVWVVVFRPRTKAYHPYSEETLRRAPIGESYMVTDVADPAYLAPRR